MCSSFRNQYKTTVHNISCSFKVELLLNEEQLKEEISILQKSLKVKSQLQNLLSYDQKPRRESAEPDLHTQNPRLNLLLKWCRTVCAFYNIKVSEANFGSSSYRIVGIELAALFILRNYSMLFSGFHHQILSGSLMRLD